MDISKAYRFVRRRVSLADRIRTARNMRRAKKLERFQFCVWTRLDVMAAFIEEHGKNLVKALDDGEYTKI